MNGRWLCPLGVLLIVVALADAQPARLGSPVLPVGCLLQPSASAQSAPKTVPYQPRAGDIVLYDDFNRFYKIVFPLAGTSAPSHAAMVIERPDGTPALLELTGPRMLTAKVCIVDIEPRLSSYPGVVMVRRLRQPLSAEQCCDLNKFAEKESGKSFALGRIVLLVTPFCPRTGLRKDLFGKTYSSRQRWFCSELVVAACASAGVVDGRRCCANATYPRDLAFDEALDLSNLYHPPVVWNAAPSR